MDLNSLASKNVAILGLGVEGLALAQFLIEKCRSITILDKKEVQQLVQDFPQSQSIIDNNRFILHLGDDYLMDLDKFDIIFRSPGIRLLLPEIQRAQNSGVEISSQIKLFFDLCPATIIGVTGTKGKGTTSSLIYEILKTEFADGGHSKLRTYLAGNIGKPAISLIPELKPEDVVVLELSSFQLQDLHRSPHIAVVLNISSDHLDYHADEIEYHEAKLPLVKYQGEADYAIINMDYLTSFEFASQTSAHCLFFSGNKSVEEGAFVRTFAEQADIYEVVARIGSEERVVCRSDEIKLFGRHNLENIAAASLAALKAGASWQSISDTAKAFLGLPHRLEYVTEVDGVKVFNDSFSTNPEPTIAAVSAFSQPKLLILGGSSKGANFDEMAARISEAEVRAVALIGDEAEHIARSLEKMEFPGRVFRSGKELSVAVQDLLNASHHGDVLIFSPACASFDMFKNYKDRGEQFKKIVGEINS